MKFGVSKGDILTLKTLIQRGKRAYIQVGNRQLLAEIPEGLRPGEKMVVTKVLPERLVLKPYSRLFQNIALSEMLKKVNLPENKTALKLLQGFLLHNLPPTPEKLQELYAKIHGHFEREKWINLTLALFHRRYNVFLDSFQGFRELFKAFCQLSTADEIILPLDFNGGFLMVQVDNLEQFRFFIYMHLQHLEAVYCRGWMDKKGEKGELNILHQPFIDNEFFSGLKNTLKENFPGWQVYIEALFKNNMRKIDGIF